MTIESVFRYSLENWKGVFISLTLVYMLIGAIKYWRSNKELILAMTTRALKGFAILFLIFLVLQVVGVIKATGYGYQEGLRMAQREHGVDAVESIKGDLAIQIFFEYALLPRLSLILLYLALWIGCSVGGRRTQEALEKAKVAGDKRDKEQKERSRRERSVQIKAAKAMGRRRLESRGIIPGVLDECLKDLKDDEITEDLVRKLVGDFIDEHEREEQEREERVTKNREKAYQEEIEWKKKKHRVGFEESREIARLQKELEKEQEAGEEEAGESEEYLGEDKTQIRPRRKKEHE